MSDTMLLYVGIFVFSMMAVGLALTMLEFSALRRREKQNQRAVERSDTKSHRRHSSDAPGKISQPETVPHGT